ncbi:hypothetical protein BpHYR1_021557 [Brachionus plicatilis]|uniref:Uncharacterized protein n=1 Tax=Brachionus plicatilis TaxID=10195 RepID=A0A3M7Q5R1_BRAPC|nr:hypothetical protein BpHYR1_021557 [Brachionus plicatilis]
MFRFLAQFLETMQRSLAKFRKRTLAKTKKCLKVLLRLRFKIIKILGVKINIKYDPFKNNFCFNDIIFKIASG